MTSEPIGADGAPASRFFRCVATFNSPYFEPVSLLAGKWYGIIEVPSTDEAETKRVAAAGLVELTAEEADEERKKKPETHSSLAPRFPLPQSAPNSHVPHQDSHRAQPAQSPTTPSDSTSELSVEDVVKPRKLKK